MDFFSQCDQIWSRLLKKSLMDNLIFVTVVVTLLAAALFILDEYFKLF